jgi:hypothetical protein
MNISYAEEEAMHMVYSYTNFQALIKHCPAFEELFCPKP